MPYSLLLFLYHLLLMAVPGNPKGDALPIPPGGVRLQENLYMDETEIANIHWLEYLYHLQKDSSAAHYTAALPDTTVWEEMDVTGYMKKNYLRSPGYRFYPVVGVSYEQMMDYCLWRSAAASAAFNNDPKNRKKYRQLQEYDVVFRWRLPTAEEWELAAQQNAPGKIKKKKGNTQPAAYSIIDSLGKNRPDKQKDLEAFLSKNPDTAINCLKEFEPGMYYGLLEPEMVYPYARKKAIGVNGQYFQLIGNVAEMTMEKGLAKGGSWAHRLEQVSVTKANTYDAPTAWLGARCIGQVYLVPRAGTQQSTSRSTPQ